MSCSDPKLTIRLNINRNELTSSWNKTKKSLARWVDLGRLGEYLDTYKDAITGRLRDSINSTISHYLSKIPQSLEDAILFVVINILNSDIKDAVTGQVKKLKYFIMAKTMQLLGKDLKRRVELFKQVDTSMQIITVSLRILNRNLTLVGSNPDLIAKLTLATKHVKLAFVAANQIVSYYNAYGIFHGGRYRDMRQHIDAAQTYLIDEELRSFSNKLYEQFLNVNVPLDLDPSEILDVTFDYIENRASNSLGDNVYVDVLHDFIENDISDRKVRVIFAYNAILREMDKLTKLVPFDPVAIYNIVRGAGLAGYAALGGGLDDIETGLDFDKDTILDYNYSIGLKLKGLQYFESKWLSFESQVTPFINIIEDAGDSIKLTYRDMLKELRSRSLSDQDLIIKQNTWHKQLTKVETDLLKIPDPLANVLQSVTVFENDFNTVLFLIDEMDLENQKAEQVYYDLFTVLTSVPSGAVHAHSNALAQNKVADIRRNLRKTIAEDETLIRAIDNLDIDPNSLKFYEDLLEYVDSVLPALYKVLINADIDTLRKIMDSVGSGNVDLGQLKAYKKLKLLVDADTYKQAINCLKNVLTTNPLDISIFSSSDDDENEEAGIDLKHMQNFQDKRIGEIDSVTNVLNRGI